MKNEFGYAIVLTVAGVGAFFVSVIAIAPDSPTVEKAPTVTTSVTPPPPPSPSLTPEPSASAQSSLTTLVNRLRVADEDNSGYAREEFGARAPTSTTRQKLLDVEREHDGTWISKWDGKVWSDPADVDADHTVALAEAWGSGARDWMPSARVDFANDLDNPWVLNLITDDLNQGAKSDHDPFDWMPDVNRCEYVREWTGVKLAWDLSADGEEKMALHFAAEECDRD